MNLETISNEIAKLGTMKFFPADPVVRLALVELMCDIAENEDQVRWLVKRVRTLYAEWPGEHELRAAFCSRFPPKDGINACSTVYLDGIPSERKPEPFKALPSGAKVSADRLLENAVCELAAAKNMNLAPIRRPPPRRIGSGETPTNPNFTPITQADIDRERQRLRDARAHRELAGERD
jgi:hypothetical protein